MRVYMTHTNGKEQNHKKTRKIIYLNVNNVIKLSLPKVVAYADIADTCLLLMNR